VTTTAAAVVPAARQRAMGLKAPDATAFLDPHGMASDDSVPAMPSNAQRGSAHGWSTAASLEQASVSFADMSLESDMSAHWSFIKSKLLKPPHNGSIARLWYQQAMDRMRHSEVNWIEAIMHNQMEVVLQPDANSAGESAYYALIAIACVATLLLALKTAWHECKSSLASESTGATVANNDKPVPAKAGKDELSFLVMVLVLLAMGSEFVTGINLTMLTPFYPGEAAARGVDPVVNGVVFSANQAAVTLFAHTSPMILRRISPFGLVSCTLLVQCILTASFGLLYVLHDPTNFAAFSVIIRFCMGIMIAFNIATYQSVVMQSLPQRLVGTGMGLLSASRAIGTAVGPSLAGCLYEFGEFSMPFLVVSLLFLAQAVAVNVLVLRVPADRLPKANPSLASVWKLLRYPSMWVLCCVQILVWSTIYGLAPLFQPYLGAEPFNLTVGQIGLALIADSLALATSASVINAVTSRLVDPQWQQAFGIWGLAISVVVVGSGPHVFNLPKTVSVVVVGLVALGGCQGLVMPAQPVVALRVLKKDAGLERRDVAGALVATFLMLSMLGSAVSPLVMTALTKAVGFGGATEWFALFVTVTYVPIFFWLARYIE